MKHHALWVSLSLLLALPVLAPIAAVGLLTLGARAPYLMVLASALLLFGGFRSLSLSLEPGARLRSYFGVYTLVEEPRRRTLVHGTTLHGVQLTGTAARERTPTSYYTPATGVGRAMRAVPLLFGNTARIGVVGLGTGTLACYARPGQRCRSAGQQHQAAERVRPPQHGGARHEPAVAVAQQVHWRPEQLGHRQHVGGEPRHEVALKLKNNDETPLDTRIVRLP